MSNSPLDSPPNANFSNLLRLDECDAMGRPLPKILGTDPKSIKAQVLTEAMSIVCKDRNEAYGPPEDNFRNIAAFWQIYLDMKNCHGVEMTPAMVADMMILMKIARNLHKPKRDNYVDIAGYAACGAEAANV